MEKETLYIIMPAYNEAVNLEAVIREWYPIVERISPKSRLVIVNDGSRDNTKEVLEELKKSYPQLLPLHKANGGHGSAVLYGYRYALHKKADYIFQTDSDGQTRPEEFGRFWRHRKSCGLLIGKRAHRQDGLGRIFVTRVLRLVLLLIFHVWVEDANTPYRLMEREELSQVLKLIPKEDALANVKMTVCYKKLKKQVVYFPITFRPRQGGTNSIDLRKIFQIGLRAVRDFAAFERKLAGRKAD